MTSRSANRRVPRPRKARAEPQAAAAPGPAPGGDGLPAVAGAAAERVVVGRVGGAHGLRGEVAVAVLSDVAGRFAPGATLLLAGRGAPPRPLVVAAARPQTSRRKDRLLGHYAGVEDRTAAEALRGGLLEVEAATVPPAPAGTYYQFDLVGCRCEDRRAGLLGEVVDVVEGGGGDLLRVAVPAQGEEPAGELLLPFVDAYLVEVDIAGRRILWDLPEGLIEACGSAS